ncbi:hypothetical protein NE619_08395 [Anaerovorax odorimutans]|uniref:Uncharacterized protein n=1 Tax=Anaerovorax odorimutans TaxID=109327 RepID=A0ABT1RNG9_9FIRM|nr:hypothetical protein [Anaerovorax odorimutans]MCQ4636748.1 hypothetical protein [Anaerovorax odorimutans]
MSRKIWIFVLDAADGSSLQRAWPTGGPAGSAGSTRNPSVRRLLATAVTFLENGPAFTQSCGFGGPLADKKATISLFSGFQARKPLKSA